MKIITVAKARVTLHKTIDEIAKVGNPIMITSKTHNAVLVSEKKWNEIMQKMN